MKKYKGIPQPQSWSEITLKQFSEYNKIIVDFQEFVEGLSEDNEEELNQLLVREVTLNFNLCELFSKLPDNEVYALDVALVKEYVEGLAFLTKTYEPKEIKFFPFKGVNYNVPDSLPISTKFGQYIESLQAEMNERYTDKNSVIYLAHQIAHIVDNGEDWSGKDRDKLAVEFEELPASIGLDFSFFLSKKCQIYSLAYLLHEKAEQEKELPFIKRTFRALGGLKRYMSWRRLKYLISLIKLRLTVFYILTQERFSNIYRILQRKAIMSQK